MVDYGAITAHFHPFFPPLAGRCRRGHLPVRGQGWRRSLLQHPAGREVHALSSGGAENRSPGAGVRAPRGKLDDRVRRPVLPGERSPPRARPRHHQGGIERTTQGRLPQGRQGCDAVDAVHVEAPAGRRSVRPHREHRGWDQVHQGAPRHLRREPYQHGRGVQRRAGRGQKVRRRPSLPGDPPLRSPRDGPVPAILRGRMTSDSRLNAPNVLTLVRILAIPVVVLILLPPAGREISFARSVAAFSLFIVATITDLFDGYIARRYHMVTTLGKLLDPLADKLLVCAAMTMLIPPGRVPAWMAVIVVGREIGVTALRGMASTEGVIIAASKLGKAKTLLLNIGVAALILHYQDFGLS